MTDPIAPVQFSTINYVKDGEKISATKQGTTVTLIGDKNGTRQMPLQDFMQKELPNAKDIKLEDTPAQDTVQLGKTKQIWDKTSNIIKDAVPEKSEVGQKLDVVA